MSEEVLTDAQVEDVFAEFANAKGDRLAEFLEAGAKTEDTPETPETPENPEGNAAPPAPESTSAAPAAGAAPAQAAPAAAAPAAAADDIWANAPAELRDAHQRALSLADQKYRSDIGRQAAHQRRIQLLEQENARLRAPKAPAAADGTAAPTTDNAAPAAPKSLRDRPGVQRAAEEYPDVVVPLLEVNEELERRLAAIENDQNLTRDERTAATYQAQEAALAAAHPDWRHACASREFDDWKEAQPKAVKDIIERNGENVVDAEEAIAMVSSFKAHFALTHQAPPPPPPGGAASPTISLAARRDAQLRAVTKAPAGGAPAMPDGPSNDAGAEAMFQHFSAKKANRK